MTEELDKLESILQGYVEDGTVPDDILTKPEAVHLMNAYNRERELRPEMLEEFAAFRDYEFLADYLSVPGSDIAKIRDRLKGRPGYLIGESKTLRGWGPFGDSKIRRLVQACRWANTLVSIYNYFVEHFPDEQFDQSAMRFHKGIKKEFGNKAANMRVNAANNFPESGGLHYVFRIAAGKVPDILDCWDPSITAVKFDIGNAVDILLGIYRHYLEHDTDKTFNAAYVYEDRGVKEVFGRQGQHIYECSLHHLGDKGGFEHLILLAAEQDITILDHWDTPRRVYEERVVQELVLVYRHYLEHGGKKVWCPTYLNQDPGLQERFPGLGSHIYDCSTHNLELKKKGGMDYLLSCAAEFEPSIEKQWMPHRYDTEKAVDSLLRMFWHYMRHDLDKDFTSHYLSTNLGLRERFQRLGQNLYTQAHRNFRGKGGVNFLVAKAAEKDPRVLDFWRFRGQPLSKAEAESLLALE